LLRNNELLRNGYNISYKPDVSNAIYTSLINPEKYLNKANCPENKILITLLDGPKTYDELINLKINLLDNYLKSLLFAEIIYKKKDLFYHKIF
ncbi:hypothetical protein COBT_002163, partial [Conglomerata obtusa]